MAEASETTPLLLDPSTGPSGSSGEYNEQNDAYSPDPTPELLPAFFRATFILTWLSVAFSLLTFAFAVTLSVMDKYSPHSYYMTWGIRDACSAILVVVRKYPAPPIFDSTMQISHDLEILAVVLSPLTSL
jgi:hypothetical protein